MWARRLIKKLSKGDREPSPLGAERARDLLAREVAFESRADFLAAIVEGIEPGQRLTEAAGRLLIGRLRGSCDGYGERNSQALSLMERFWFQVAERTGDPLALCCHAEAVFAQGRESQALTEFLEAFDERPELVFEFGGGLGTIASERGPDAELALKLARLRALLAEDGEEEVRELYGELLDDFAGSPDAVARIRIVGREIEQAERDGSLPRVMVRRGASRSVDSPDRNT